MLKLSLLCASQIFLTLSQDPGVPDVPTRYHTTVEANIANKGKSYIMDEWYDADANQAKRIFYDDGYQFTILEDMNEDVDTLWIYGQYSNDLDSTPYFCYLEAYSNKSSSWLEALQVLGQWLNTDTGDMNTATYVDEVGDVDDNGMEDGDYNMRGLLGNKWTKQAVYNETRSDGNLHTDIYDINYYWSLSNWTYASHNDQVPLRIEVIGTHNETNASGLVEYYEFYHSYEYIAFFSGENAFDDEVLDFYTDMPNWVDSCDVSHYCSHYPSSDICSESQGPTLPELATQYIATIEYNDATTDTTYLMKEYYDYTNNRAHVEIYYDDSYTGNAFHQLDLDTYEQKWMWVGEESDSDNPNSDDGLSYCQMSLVDSNFTGWDFFIQEVSGSIAPPRVWWHFNNSENSDVTWLGYTTIRDEIKAEKWKSTWDESYRYQDWWVEINADSYYWFNRDEWNMSFSNFDSNSILRLAIEGNYTIYNFTDDNEKVFWTNGTMDASMDIIGFVTGYVDDSMFEIPGNWREECTIEEEYCQDDRFSNLDVCYNGPELPTLPEDFMTTVECIFTSKNFSMNVDEFYDYDANQARVIIYPYNYKSTLSGMEYPATFSTHYLEDGEIFWTWYLSSGDSVDSDNEEVFGCSLKETRSIGTRMGLNTWFDENTDHVQTTKWLFDWVVNNSVNTYVGTKQVGGVWCDQWKHKMQSYNFSYQYNGDYYDYETNMTVVNSFMTDEYKSEELYGDWGIPVRADVWGHSTVTLRSSGAVVGDYDFEHRYNYIKFLPYKPDSYWFEPPNGVSCNISSYCYDLENYQDTSGSSSSSESSDAGESSEEYEDWCDEMIDGMITTDFDSSSTGCNGSSSSDDDSESGGNAGLWILAVILCILCGIGGYYFGTYRAKRKAPAVSLSDQDGNKL